MRNDRCVGCEQIIQQYPCRYCGFDPGKQPQAEYALPYNSILHGRYLIGRILGQGGFGITYIGWDLSLEVKVAIKEYYPSGQVYRTIAMGRSLMWNTGDQALSMREQGLNTFLKEARKMARVDEIPQVVRVKDTFIENDTAYIVMAFVDGETLKDCLTAPAQWPGRKPRISSCR